MLAIHHANLVLETGILWDGMMLVEDGRICAIGKAGTLDVPEGTQWVDAQDAYVGPGFVDIHVHGGGAYESHIDPLHTAEFFLRYGTTTILATPSYDQNFLELMEGIRRGKQAMKAGGAGKAIAGLYLEGPYMNVKYGAGAFRNPWGGPVQPAEYTALVDEAGDAARIWAIAPEREGLLPFLEYARAVNPDTVFALGHSEATPNQIRALGKYRPTLMTHCTNATGRIGESGGIRGVGPDEYCFTTPEMYAELICDSCAIHVKPDMQRMILHCKGLEKTILITDSNVCDAPNPPEFSHIEDLTFDEQGGLNGSKLTMDQACRNIMTHTNCGITQAFLLASRNPARVLGLEHEIGTLEPGKKANLVFVDHKFRVQRVMLEGNFVE